MHASLNISEVSHEYRSIPHSLLLICSNYYPCVIKSPLLDSLLTSFYVLLPLPLQLYVVLSIIWIAIHVGDLIMFWLSEP